MIEDVKSYFNIVGNRLSKVFTVEEFGQEEELEFWALSAEHMSRKTVPGFKDISKWMDMLYQAPVHVVYKKERDKLKLSRRQIFSSNIIRKSGKEPGSERQQSHTEKEFIESFQQQLQNLEQKKDWDEVYLEHGISNHTIGKCEHIPLYHSDGNIWGMYLVGPYVKSPESMVPKLSIVSRLLSEWLIELEESEESPQKDYRTKVEKVFGELGSGKLNTDQIAGFISRYLLNITGAEGGCVVASGTSGNRILSWIGLDEQLKSEFKIRGDKSLFSIADNDISISDFGKHRLSELNIGNYEIFSFPRGCIFLHFDQTKELPQPEEFFTKIADTIQKLLDFEDENARFSGELIESYYQMLRKIETGRPQTQFHTPRLMAFAERFAMFFGLNEHEKDIIIQAAKLHDIGYTGTLGLDKSKNIGGEINHPLIGALMLEKLPVHEDVVTAVKTHHEWVNGKGEPNQLKGDEISWSGKIIGIFEFVVEFIEDHEEYSDHSNLIEKLSKELMSRADQQFDMVIVPTAVQLLQSLGWEGCLKLGTKEQ